MATIRNPQQVGHTSRDDARIEGARDIESHQHRLYSRCDKSPSFWKARTCRCAGALSTTGGCLNPSAEVLLAERETQPGLPLFDKGRADRTAASDLTGLAPRSHSTLKVG
jgi:hypothetical protein